VASAEAIRGRVTALTTTSTTILVISERAAALRLQANTFAAVWQAFWDQRASKLEGR
jgi:hypothetical protein